MGWDGKDQGRCFLVASRNAFRLSSIDVIALAVNPLHFSIRSFGRSLLNEKQIGVNYDITENPILNAIQGDPPRAEKDVAEKDYARELYKLKIGRAICVTVILDGRLEQNFSWSLLIMLIT